MNADASMIAFRDKYRDTVEVATIEFMPHTTLTVAESKRINALLQFKVGDLWERYLQGDPSLVDAEIELVR